MVELGVVRFGFSGRKNRIADAEDDAAERWVVG